MTKLHKFVSPEHLPTNYGGTLKVDYTAKDWYPCAEKYNDFFAQYTQFGFKE
jgi:retinaldehyde-binding protein 1